MVTSQEVTKQMHHVDYETSAITVFTNDGESQRFVLLQNTSRVHTKATCLKATKKEIYSCHAVNVS